jgi:TPR repeat protein
VLRLVVPSLPEVDADVLSAADAGEPQAQNDLAMALHAAGFMPAAVLWWLRAARGGNTDAMQWLGRAYLLGEGAAANASLALMWLDKAATAGHGIARAQMYTLMNWRLRLLQTPLYDREKAA